jgi:uncharacterized membrane protein YhiD involved in acid resistance
MNESALLILSSAIWSVVGWMLLGVGLSGILLVLFVAIESKKHERRLRRLQRETDEKRQRQDAPTERMPRRQNFLP